jgi:hypothetical protein
VKFVVGDLTSTLEVARDERLILSVSLISSFVWLLTTMATEVKEQLIAI